MQVLLDSKFGYRAQERLSTSKRISLQLLLNTIIISDLYFPQNRQNIAIDKEEQQQTKALVFFDVWSKTSIMTFVEKKRMIEFITR